MYNDELEAVIIFEAKDSLEKLLEKEQAKKSAAVVVKLAELLQSKGNNEFWKGRENYRVILGLLWGSTDNTESDSEKDRLYDHYHALVEGEESVYNDLIVGVETLYAHGNLKCEGFFKSYNSSVIPYGKAVIESLI